MSDFKGNSALDCKKLHKQHSSLTSYLPYYTHPGSASVSYKKKIKTKKQRTVNMSSTFSFNIRRSTVWVATSPHTSVTDINLSVTYTDCSALQFHVIQQRSEPRTRI